MKNFLSCFLLISFLNVVYSQNINNDILNISKSIIEQLETNNRKSIAIVDFNSPNGDISELGRSLSNKLRINIAKNNQNITIVNRSVLNKALEEEQLLKDGVINPETAKKIKFIGIEVVVIGEISDYGNNYSVEIQLIDTETSDIVGGEILEIPVTENFRELNEKILVYNSVKPKKSNNKAGIRDGDNTDIIDENDLNLSYEEDPFLFECIECRQSSSKVICKFKITSLNRDANLAACANNNSRIFDEKGNEYFASLGKLANTSGGGWVSKSVVEGVSIDAEFTFANVNTTINMIKKLDFLVGEAHVKNIRLQLRNIPVLH